MRRQRQRRAAAHKKAGLRPRLDQPTVFQHAKRFGDRGQADRRRCAFRAATAVYRRGAACRWRSCWRHRQPDADKAGWAWWRSWCQSGGESRSKPGARRQGKSYGKPGGFAQLRSTQKSGKGASFAVRFYCGGCTAFCWQRVMLMLAPVAQARQRQLQCNMGRTVEQLPRQNRVKIRPLCLCRRSATVQHDWRPHTAFRSPIMTPTRHCVAAGQLLTLPARAGQLARCASGVLWLTAGDGDVVLRPGDSYRCPPTATAGRSRRPRRAVAGNPECPPPPPTPPAALSRLGTGAVWVLASRMSSRGFSLDRDAPVAVSS